MSGFGVFCVVWFICSFIFCVSTGGAARKEAEKKPDYTKLYLDVMWYVTLFVLGLLPQLLAAIYKLSVYVYNI